MSFFGAHWYPCFGFLVMSPLGFKARVGSAFFTFFFGGKCNVHSPRFTSGATCADHLVAGIAANHFPTGIGRGGTWLGFEQAITRTEDECATIVPATRFKGQDRMVHLDPARSKLLPLRCANRTLYRAGTTSRLGPSGKRSPPGWEWRGSHDPSLSRDSQIQTLSIATSSSE